MFIIIIVGGGEGANPEKWAPKVWGPEGWGPAGWGPEGWGAKKLSLFPRSRHNFLSFFPLLGVFSWNFGGV